MENCEVYDILIQLVKSFKNKSKEHNPHIKSSYKGEDVVLWSTHYILNQSLRQIYKETHYFISKRAQEKWNQITTDSIMKYFTTNMVEVKSDGVDVDIYVGASKTPTKRLSLKKGDKFKYNAVFHDDHIVPIKVIIDELTALNEEELNYENVNRILDKIYICRMLKEEDRKIPHRYKRSSNYQEVLDTVYKDIIDVIKIEN